MKFPINYEEENTMYQEGKLLLAPSFETESKLSDLADLLMSWKLAKENAEEQLKKANERIRAAERLIYEKMQAEEIEKFAHAGMLFYPYVNSYPRCTPGKEDEYFAWLEEHGEGGIVKRSIHPQTHRSWFKQHEEFHEELTEKGLVDV